jgi:organic radical activating enzyme
MFLLEISLTEACNNDCAYCVSKRRRDPRHHSHAENEELAKSGKPYQFNTEMNLGHLKNWLLFQKGYLDGIKLVITGGEPTTHPGWLHLLEWVKDSGFEKPLLYTNGFGLKDLFQSYRAKDLCSVILTHHGDEQSTRLSVQMLKELGMKFVVKILVGLDYDIEKLRAFANSLVCEVVFEGIKKIPKSENEVLESLKTMNPLKDENPYYWRYEGYGDKIARDRTEYAPAYILTIVPIGAIFNCHHFNEGCIGFIKKPERLENLLPAGCVYLDTLRLEGPNPFAENHCELMHYVLKYSTGRKIWNR